MNDYICPLMTSNPKKPVMCIKDKCAFWTCVRGKNPQSNQEIDEYGCAVAWLPVLLIENAQQQRQTGAALESFRNEMVKGNNAFMHLMSTTQQKLEEQNE